MSDSEDGRALRELEAYKARVQGIIDKMGRTIDELEQRVMRLEGWADHYRANSGPR